ncbi:hypothetical protein [Castellaniella sp.]|uniref:hypothetical protein n=1 Tax=Castellaniella sp. TaxID=1955812 RepID=UPI003A8D1835
MKKVTIAMDEDLFYEIKSDAINKRLTLKEHMGNAIKYGFKAIKIQDEKRKKSNDQITKLDHYGNGLIDSEQQIQ